MPNILAIETSSQICSVAIRTANNKLVERQAHGLRQHSQVLLSLIDSVLSEASISLDDLDALAWGCGPGSFTGLRLSAAVIQGIAFAKSLPVVSISSMAALAQQAWRSFGLKTVSIAQDARMQQVYWGQFTCNADDLMECAGEVRLCDVANLAKLAQNSAKVNAIGDGWQRYETELLQAFPSAHLWHDLQCPQAHDVLQLAEVELALGNTVSASDVQPAYLKAWAPVA